MKHVSKMLVVMWPNGIPVQDYDKAVTLLARLERPARSVAVRPAPPPRPATSLDRVMAVLSTGPATAREVAEVTGINLATARGILGAHARVVGTRPNPSGFGIPANIYALKDGK